MPLRDRVALAFEGRDPVLGRGVAFFFQGLILLSILALTIETLPGLPGWLVVALVIEEKVVLAIFAIEYLLRIWSARRPLAYVFSFWGLIDLGATLPSIIFTGTDMRSLRIFRMLRLLRLLKLMRYARAAERLGLAFRDIRDELILFLMVSLMLLYVSAVGIYFFEHDAQPERFASIPQALWWAVATLTTVGYGDVYPITPGGRIFTGAMLLIGIGVFAVPTGLIATALTRTRPATDADRPHDVKDEPAKDPR